MFGGRGRRAGGGGGGGGTADARQESTHIAVSSSAADGTALAWDPHTGTLLFTFKHNSSPHGGLCVLPRKASGTAGFAASHIVATQTKRPTIHCWAWGQVSPMAAGM